MAQFARPNGDNAVQNWYESVGNTQTNIYAAIDESTRSDSDWIYSTPDGVPDTNPCEISLSSVTDPESSTGHVVRYTYLRSKTNKDLTLVVRLMQGTTTIASWTHANPSDVYALAEQTLTENQANSITDYSSLALQFEVTVNAGGGGHAEVSWAELETPNAPTGTDVDSFKTAYSKGAQNTNHSQNGFTKGKLSETDFSSVFLQGADGSDSSNFAFTKGEDVYKSATGAYADGKAEINSSLAAYISSLYSEQDVVPAYLVGESIETSHTSIYILGKIETFESVFAYLSGKTSSQSSKSAYTSGPPIYRSSTSAYISVFDSPCYPKVIKIALHVPGGNLIPANNSIAAFLDGIGQGTGSLLAFIDGGWNTSSTNAFMSGMLRHASHAFTEGILASASSSVGAYLNAEIITSTSAFLSGHTATKASLSGYICGLIATSHQSANAYIAGISRDRAPAFIDGLIKRTDYIWLKTSDNGETLSKKFIVLQHDYDDGTKETSEEVKKTISGGTSKSIGETYITWNMIIRVKAEQDRLDYGSRTDLEYLYGLNNPNATPSNVITFVDHRGYEYKVYLRGNMQKNLITVAVEGTEAWYLYKLELIGINGV